MAENAVEVEDVVDQNDAVEDGDEDEDEDEDNYDVVDVNEEFETDDDHLLDNIEVIEEKVCRGFKFVDFLSDIGSNERGLLDGEVLLASAFADNLLDWTHGGQFLHVAHAVEVAIHNIVRLGGRIDVVFFDAFGSFWLQLDPLKCLAREAVILHLRKYLPSSIPIHVLPVENDLWWPNQSLQTNWARLLSDIHPAYILTSLGWPQLFEHQFLSVTNLSKLFVFSCQLASLDIVDLLSIEVDGAKLMAFHAMTPPLGVLHRQQAFVENALLRIATAAQATLDSSSYFALSLLPIPDTLMGVSLRRSAGAAALVKIWPVSCEMAELWTLYLVVIEHLQIRQRAFRLPDDTALVRNIPIFLNQIASVLLSIIKGPWPTERQCDLADLIDGRLLHYLALIQRSHYYDEKWHNAGLTSEQTQELWATRGLIASVALARFPNDETLIRWSNPGNSRAFSCETSEADSDACAKTMALLETQGKPSDVPANLPSVRSPHIDKIIGRALADKLQPWEVENEPIQDRQVPFRDHHWHGMRLLSYDLEENYAPEQDPWRAQLTEKKRLKLRQHEASGMASAIEYMLAGTPVKLTKILQHDDDNQRQKKLTAARLRIQQYLLTGEHGNQEQGNHEQANSKTNSKKNKSNRNSKTKDDIIAENSRRIMEKDNNTLRSSAEQNIKDYANKDDPLKTIRDLEEIEKNLDTPIYLWLRELQFLFDGFNSKRPLAQKQVGYLLIQKVLRNVVAKSEQSLLSDEDWKALKSYAKLLQLPDLEASIRSIAIQQGANLRAQDVTQEHLPSVNFQLENAPEHLARPEGREADDRLRFRPDDWQRILLDVVDSEYSALVVAPTSMGKTFIAYYAMESILRQSADNVVVYVSPTKALANQVYLEVLARFEKNSKLYERSKIQSMVGVFTRDQRGSETDCQILVTVPHCLEIQLMAQNNNGWTRRIKYVIFDEIHLVGSTGGEVWERLLLMINCPFLALSATLGNGARFQEWLERLEQLRNRVLVPITQTARYNDLAYYMYVPPPPQTDQPNQSIVSVNPICSVVKLAQQPLATPSLQQVRFPADVRLLPEHCIELYTAIRQLAPHLVADIEPEAFFSAATEQFSWNISMSHSQIFEKKLLEILRQALNNPPHPHFEDQLIQQVPSLNQTIEAMNFIDDKVGEFQFLQSQITSLLHQLRNTEWLPTLVFCWSRVNCKRLALAVMEEQQKAKQAYYEQNSAKKTQLERRVHERQQQRDRVRTPNSRLSRDAEEAIAAMDAELAEAVQGLDSFNNDINRQFAFVLPQKDLLTKEELSKWEYLRVFNEDDKLHQALLYGIGVHYNGLPKAYRRTVERLFRMKRLAVLICTTTLAVGINMPCKTVVMAGEASYLNAQTYRQISGRSGRRGFDLRGNVVFFGIRPTRLRRLLRSELPDLRANPVISASITLRLLVKLDSIVKSIQDVTHQNQRANHQEELEHFIQSAHRLLHYPLFQGNAIHNDNNPLGNLQLPYAFRFCIDVLRQAHLINHQGEPTDWGTLVGHLYYTEPANFGLLELLVQHDLNRIATDQAPGDRSPELRLLTVICHLFMREPLFPKRLAHRPRQSASIVLLPPLDRQTEDCLINYNRRITAQATVAWRVFTQVHADLLGLDNILPVTNTPFGLNKPANLDAPLINSFEQHALPVQLRSAFVALSGYGDEFEDLDELTRSQRRGLNIDARLTPVFRLSRRSLNAYILDFYQHGQVAVIERDNGVQECYDTFKSALMILKSIAGALGRRQKEALKAGVDLPVASAVLIDRLNTISNTFERRFNTAFPNERPQQKKIRRPRKSYE